MKTTQKTIAAAVAMMLSASALAQQSTESVSATAATNTSSTSVSAEQAAPSAGTFGFTYANKAATNLGDRNVNGINATLTTSNTVTASYKLTEKSSVSLTGAFELNDVPNVAVRKKYDKEATQDNINKKVGYVPRDPYIAYAGPVNSLLGSDEFGYAIRYYALITASSQAKNSVGKLRALAEAPFTINKILTLAGGIDYIYSRNNKDEEALATSQYGVAYFNVTKDLQLYHQMGVSLGLGRMTRPDAKTGAFLASRSVGSGYVDAQSFDNETGVNYTLNKHAAFTFAIANSAGLQDADNGFRMYHPDDVDMALATTLTF